MLSKIKFQFSRRKEHLEQLEKEEAAQLKERYQQTKSQQSVISDLIKANKWKMFRYTTLLIGSYFVFQTFNTIEISFNPKFKILPLKEHLEIKLADSTIKQLSLEKKILKDETLNKKISPLNLLLLDEQYPIFNLLPNDYLIANKQFLEQLNQKQIEQLLNFCKDHNAKRTNCNLLDLNYIPQLTMMRIKGFKNLKRLSQIIIAKEYFFITIPEEFEIKNDDVQKIVKNYSRTRKIFIFTLTLIYFMNINEKQHYSAFILQQWWRRRRIKQQNNRIKIYYTSLSGQSNKIKQSQIKAFLILEQKQWSLQKIDCATDKKSVQFIQAFKEYGYELPLIFIDNIYIGDGDKIQELEDNGFLDEIYEKQYLERCLLCNMDRKNEEQKQCSDCKKCFLFFRII